MKQSTKMIFSKKQRREIYEAAMFIAPSYSFIWKEGLCHILKDVALELFGKEVSVLERPQEYPEFIAQRPENAKAYWWTFDEKGLDMRLEALEKAIALTFKR